MKWHNFHWPHGLMGVVWWSAVAFLSFMVGLWMHILFGGVFDRN